MSRLSDVLKGATNGGETPLDSHINDAVKYALAVNHAASSSMTQADRRVVYEYWCYERRRPRWVVLGHFPPGGTTLRPRPEHLAGPFDTKEAADVALRCILSAGA